MYVFNQSTNTLRVKSINSVCKQTLWSFLMRTFNGKLLCAILCYTEHSNTHTHRLCTDSMGETNSEIKVSKVGWNDMTGFAMCWYRNDDRKHLAESTGWICVEQLATASVYIYRRQSGIVYLIGYCVCAVYICIWDWYIVSNNYTCYLAYRYRFETVKTYTQRHTHTITLTRETFYCVQNIHSENNNK